MPKTATFTTITPLPAGITRKSVLDMYRDHLAMIDLNPLVVERYRCKPPGYAPTDEYWATWYTIKDKVSYLPGGLAQGSVSYHACFHDQPDGLETHVYAPLGLDIRGKWSVGGSLPGEPKPMTEKGLPTPRHGLYIREDVRMTCSSLLLGFVKRTFKDSHARLVEQLVERAHLLESNFANERLNALRNVDPGERMAIGDIFIAPPPDYQPVQYELPACQTPALPPPLTLHRTQSSARYSPPSQATHNRSHSDPIASPGFSQASTLIDEADRPPTPPKDNDRSMTLQFAYVDQQVSASAPEPSMYLLPATTYDGGLPRQRERMDSVHPGNQEEECSERVISLHPESSTHQRKESNVSLYPPRISYRPEERPISFTFPFSESAFDTRSVSASAPDTSNLLDEIDNAIDQMCMYAQRAPTPAAELLLPATKYEPEPLVLPSTIYNPQQELKKDSDSQHSRQSSESNYSKQSTTPPLQITPTSSQASLPKAASPISLPHIDSQSTLQKKASDAQLRRKNSQARLQRKASDAQLRKIHSAAQLHRLESSEAPLRRNDSLAQLQKKGKSIEALHQRNHSWHTKELPPLPVEDK